MTFKNLHIDHELSVEAKAWLKQEIEEQEERFAVIEKQMDDLAPTREKWYQEFFDRLRRNGFNVDGDEKVRISASDLPVKPEGRKDQVVWKYGVEND